MVTSPAVVFARIAAVIVLVLIVPALGHLTLVEGRPAASRDDASNTGATAAAAPKPRGAAGDWDLKFQDEFNGSSLDLGKWRPNWLSDKDSGITPPINSLERSCYDPEQVTVSGGTLNLTAARRSCQLDDGRSYDYASGVVQSRHHYQFTYGFAEARMYLPPNRDRAKGPLGSCGPNWAAFWINGYGSTVSEIDVMECLEHNVESTYHWDGYTKKAYDSPARWRKAMPAAAGGWHTFGVKWQPNVLEFYYDGVRIGRHQTAVPNDPHYLIANLAVSGDRPTTPQTLKIDYIRVWQ